MSNLRSSSNLFYFKDVTMCRKGQTIWNSLQGATFPAYRISLIAARKNIQGKAETISKKLISLPPPPLYLSGTYTLVFLINMVPRLLLWRKNSNQCTLLVLLTKTFDFQKIHIITASSFLVSSIFVCNIYFSVPNKRGATLIILEEKFQPICTRIIDFLKKHVKCAWIIEKLIRILSNSRSGY